MDTTHLEEFIVLARELNVSRAAKQLYVTRPTLMGHIQALEAELGCRLVVHSGNRIELTQAGKRFWQIANEQLAAWSAIRDEFTALSENLVSVCVPVRALPWLEPVLYQARTSIQRDYPGKRVEVETISGVPAQVDALNTSNADIVIAGFKSFAPAAVKPPFAQGPRGFLLSIDKINLYVGQQSPLFEKERICAADLDGATIVLSPDIYASWVRDDVAGQFLARGARVILREKWSTDYGGYCTDDCDDCIAIMPITILSRYGIDVRVACGECRIIDMEDFALFSEFYAFFDDAFLATENGRLLFDTMERIAAQRLASGCVG